MVEKTSQSYKIKFFHAIFFYIPDLHDLFATPGFPFQEINYQPKLVKSMRLSKKSTLCFPIGARQGVLKVTGHGAKRSGRIDNDI